MIMGKVTLTKKENRGHHCMGQLNRAAGADSRRTILYLVNLLYLGLDLWFEILATEPFSTGEKNWLHQL